MIFTMITIWISIAKCFSGISEINENETISVLPLELATEYKLINRDALHKTCVQQLTFLLGHKPSFTGETMLK